MQNENFECWVEVPGTDGRFMVSHRGRLKAFGKKRRVSRKTFIEVVNEPRRLVCDYKTGRLGWWVFFDNARLFLPRDELMALFPPEFRDIDHSLDAEAEARRDETYLDPDALRKGAMANGKGTDE